jgi:hypothetical protein
MIWRRPAFLVGSLFLLELAVACASRAVSKPPNPPRSAAVVNETAGAESDAADPNAGSAGADNDAGTDDSELVEDEADESIPSEPPSSELSTRAHPLDGWSAERIRQVAKDNLKELGPMSIGQPNSGALLNGTRAEKCALFEPVDTPHAFGTDETLNYLSDAIRKVQAEFPDTPPLSLGDISGPRGGPISPHISHQAGRDVDISFYYSDGTRWYARATEKNLDLPRTWSFVRALITETDVEMILIDHSVQGWLRRYAIEHGEDRAWVESLFAGSNGGQRAIVRHAPGHATHLHVRFFNPIAQETARRAGSALASAGVIPELVRYVRHRARRGDTLAKIAKKYSVSVAAIRAANGLRSSRIREQREYRIPVRAERAPPSATPLRFPSRRLPPALLTTSERESQARVAGH